MNSGKLGGGGAIGPEDYGEFNPSEMMTGHAQPGGGGGGIIGPEDYGEYDPHATPHRTPAIVPHHQHPHHAFPAAGGDYGAGGDTYTPPPGPPQGAGWAMPQGRVGGQTVDPYAGASYQAPPYDPSSSPSYLFSWYILTNASLSFV